MSGSRKTEGVRRIWDKYKFVALTALAGVVLLAWPEGGTSSGGAEAAALTSSLLVHTGILPA